MCVYAKTWLEWSSAQGRERREKERGKQKEMRKRTEKRQPLKNKRQNKNAPPQANLKQKRDSNYSETTKICYQVD